MIETMIYTAVAIYMLSVAYGTYYFISLWYPPTEDVRPRRRTEGSFWRDMQ